MAETLSLTVPTGFEDCTEILLTASLALERNLQAQFAHDFFQSVLGVNLGLDQSLDAWQRILERRGQLTGEGDSNLSFRQALLEYFLHSTLLHDPIITELGELQRLRLNSTTDHLTGAHNRRFFDASLAKEVKRATRYGNDLSLVLFDLNRFKEVNDTHGHASGDKLLTLTGKLLLECVRNSDNAFRIGGDEFSLLLPQTSHPGAELIAERVRKQFAEVIMAENLNVAISLAYGVATSPREARDANALFELADHRLYDFKRAVGSPRCLPRRFERIPLRVLDAYGVLRTNGESHQGHLLDFSIGGVGLRVPAEIDIPPTFSGELYLQVLPPVPVSLRKVYLGPVEPEGRRLGCAFVGPVSDQIDLPPSCVPIIM